MDFNKETFGLISGVLVAMSSVPYILRTWQSKIHPNVASFCLWTAIGFVLLLTYQSSGAGANIWPVVFGFINPLLITIATLIKNSSKIKFTRLEWVCIAVSAISLAMWVVMRDDRLSAQYALYMAIVADACAAIPTIAWVRKHPDQDRPFAWGLFTIAYSLALFAVPEYSFANCILPIYMFLVGGYITWELAKFRIKDRTPFTEWV